MREPSDELNQTAELIFSMIHNRFIKTSQGLAAMHQKYLVGAFGYCPRILCKGQKVVPVNFISLMLCYC